MGGCTDELAPTGLLGPPRAVSDDVWCDGSCGLSAGQMTGVIGHQFRLKDGRVIRLPLRAYSKRFIPPRKLSWQEKLYLSRGGTISLSPKRRKKGD